MADEGLEAKSETFAKLEEIPGIVAPSLASVRSQHHGQPDLTAQKAKDPRGFRAACIAPVEALHAVLPSHYGEVDHNAAQSTYLTAAGSLIQFNAIMAAIHGATVTSGTGILKSGSAVALVLHVLSAFLLCWAARPVDPGRAMNQAMAFAVRHQSTHDTFLGYRRGWRASIVAMIVSCAVLGLFLYESFFVRAADLQILP